LPEGTIMMTILSRRAVAASAIALSALFSTSLGGCAWIEAVWSSAAEPVEAAAPRRHAARDVRIARPAAKPKSKKVALQRPAEAPPAQPSAPRQADDGCEQCVLQLKALIEDSTRSWIKRREPPVALATGVRMFAYRALRERLDCAELHAGLDEMEDAARTFNEPQPGLSQEQIVRVKTLSADVASELRQEAAQRCSTQRSAGNPGSLDSR
jgi:hypothetical protein